MAQQMIRPRVRVVVTVSTPDDYSGHNTLSAEMDETLPVNGSWEEVEGEITEQLGKLTKQARRKVEKKLGRTVKRQRKAREAAELQAFRETQEAEVPAA